MSRYLWIVLLLAVGCRPEPSSRTPPGVDGRTLPQAREGFVTSYRPPARRGGPAPEPPPAVFRKVTYPSAVGDLAAYITPDPGDGKKRPAVVWITGGDCNTIGDVWSPRPPANDQSAAAYRRAGLVMMFPSQRGGNDNPGPKQLFLGEVDDVIAAADHLAKLDYVDPGRIYLGGHSTGGTLAMLVAESTDRFRAVFAFGPAGDIAGYGTGTEHCPFDPSEQREIALRSPIHWLDGVKTPTFVIEGERGNALSLRMMAQATDNPRLRFLTVRGHDHFSVLAPVNRLIAQKILADAGPACDISIRPGELAAAARR